MFVCCLTTNSLLVGEASRLLESDCLFACLQSVRVSGSALQRLMCQLSRPKAHEWHVCLCADGILHSTLLHSGLKGVTISVISGFNPVQRFSPARCRVDRPVWRTSLMRFQDVRPIYDFSFIPCWVRFSSYQVLAVLRHVNASLTDISCPISAASPGSTGCSTGQDLGEDRERERELERLTGKSAV